jgi:hypothetical protein
VFLEKTEQLKVTVDLVANRGGPLFEKYLAGVDRTPPPSVDFLVALNQRLSDDIRYLIRMELGVQSPENPGTGLRLVPRLGLAAGAAAAPPGPGGALCQRLPADPAASG